MFGFFRKSKAEPAKVEPPQSNGIFSTDLELLKKKPKLADVIALFERSFQKDHRNFLPLRENGEVYATDSAELANTVFAMDNAQPWLKVSNSYGAGIPWAQLSWYASQGFIGYQNAAMISQQWLINKACSMPALDAVRNGFEITVNDGTEIDPDVLTKIHEKDKELEINDKCIDQIYKGRIFGIRIAMFVVEYKDKLAYEKPFNPDGITPGSYKGITQIDPYWITPELDFDAVTPGSQHFYEPTWWRVNGKRIHRTHLIIMRNDNVPDILKPTYLYGGIPIPQKIAERVYAAERTANEAPMLTMTKRMTVYKVDTSQAVANPQAVEQKLQVWSELMNNYGIKLIGGDEEVNQFDTALADVDAVIMTQYQLVAAASEVPATKLLGTSPKGFNATGEYEAKSYRQMLESLQKNYLTPLVDRHHLCLIRSEFPELAKKKDFRLQIVWKSVDSPTAKEIAEINNIKADAANKLVQAGAIDGYDVRQNIIADPESGYNGIEPIVEGGVGDRDHEQEVAEKLLDNSSAPQGSKKEKQIQVQDAIEGKFDPIDGTLDGARIITHQRFLDEKKVAEKIKAKDFMVNVTPEFMDQGKKYRMVIDGHHSLAAAMRVKAIPVFVTAIPRSEVFNAATRQATDSK